MDTKIKGDPYRCIKCQHFRLTKDNEHGLCLKKQILRKRWSKSCKEGERL